MDARLDRAPRAERLPLPYGRSPFGGLPRALADRGHLQLRSRRGCDCSCVGPAALIVPVRNVGGLLRPLRDALGGPRHQLAPEQVPPGQAYVHGPRGLDGCLEHAARELGPRRRAVDELLEPRRRLRRRIRGERLVGEEPEGQVPRAGGPGGGDMRSRDYRDLRHSLARAVAAKEHSRLHALVLDSPGKQQDHLWRRPVALHQMRRQSVRGKMVVRGFPGDGGPPPLSRHDPRLRV
mmetsp:Transcript_13762/g.42676  ORF Transcript_13762/g.42676 Transcript_13762/m.42676 type:complete len:236 (+) Transcript_13762:608-1315(+)